jgi:hypothetical protein
MANRDKNTTFIAMDKDLSLTSIHLKATRTLPILPVLPSTIRRNMTMLKVWKTPEQSIGHQPPTASSLGSNLNT